MGFAKRANQNTVTPNTTSEFDEAFASVLQQETKRRAVWVVGLVTRPLFEGFNGMCWGACRGFVNQELPGGLLSIFVPHAGGTKCWIKKPEEVFENEYDCEAAWMTKCQKQAIEMLEAFKPEPPRQEPAPGTSPEFYMDYKYGTK